ncbi:MAG: peptidoglycan DD-metalloendopeptidase family protein [Chloroflexota bacterium]
MGNLVMQYPVDNPQFTQVFGENPAFYQDRSQHPGWSYPGHNGVDFGGWLRDAIRASAAGRVAYVGFEAGGYGNYVKIDHGNNIYSYYAHLKRAMTSTGLQVGAGMQIGEMGETGCATGVHLHWGIKAPGGSPAYSEYVDPLRFIQLNIPTDQTIPEPVLPQVIGGRYEITTNNLFIRSDPTTASTKIGQLYRGAQIEVIDNKADPDGNVWFRIFRPSGWIFSKYTKSI